jgi:hypothetical protein
MYKNSPPLINWVTIHGCPLGQLGQLGQLHVCLDVKLNLHESCFGLSISQEWNFKTICKVVSRSQYKMVMYFKQCMYHIDLRRSASSFLFYFVGSVSFSESL